MFVDELMYHVSRKWYWLLWASMSLISLLIIIAYLLAKVSSGIHFGEETFTLNISAPILALFELGYLMVFFWIIASRSMASACFVGTVIHTLTMINVLDQTIGSIVSLPFVLIWVLIGFLNGMFGPAILLGSLLVSLIIVLLNSHFMIPQISNMAYALMGGSLLASAGGYFFWKNKFITISSEQVSKLSGMLKSKEQQSEILIQSIADGIIVMDTRGTITLINKAATQLTSWPEKDAVGFDARAVVRLLKDERTNEMISDQNHPFAQALRNRKHISKTLQLLNRNNRIIYISLVASPVILPKTKELVGAVAVLRDVSKEKEEEKKRADFISTASHEMRTPVAAIEGYLALAMNESVSTIDERARGYLSKAHASTQHLGQLFLDLLTSAKAEDGRLSSHSTIIEMGQFLEQLSQDLSFGAKKKGLETEFIINKASDSKSGSTKKSLQPFYYVYADPDRLREVITNVFDNAIKYTDRGKVSLGLTGNNEIVQIKISDSGIGIPKEDLPHLFQKFYRVDTSVTRAVGGTGLGLFICRKILELYNGHIWAESSLGRGSTFYINLPRISSSRAQQMQASPTITPTKTQA